MMSVIKNKWTYKVFSSISPRGSWRQEVEEFSPFCQKKPEITFLQFPIFFFSIISTILPFCQKKPLIAFQDFSSFHNFTFLSEKARENISTISYFFFCHFAFGYCLQCFLNSPPGENVNSFTPWWMIYLTREYLIIHLVVKVLTFSPHGEWSIWLENTWSFTLWWKC